MLKKILAVTLIIGLTLTLVTVSYSPGFATGKVFDERTLAPLVAAKMDVYVDTRNGPKAFHMRTGYDGIYKIPIIFMYGALYEPRILITKAGYLDRFWIFRGQLITGHLADFPMRRVPIPTFRNMAHLWQTQPYTQG